MKWNIIAGLALVIVSFLAGWQVNGWRMGKQKAEVQVSALKDDVTDATNAFNKTKQNLNTVVTMSAAAAKSTQDIIDMQGKLRDENRKNMEQINARTGELQNEIDKLGLPKCVFSPATGGLWKQIGEAANAGRYSLYGTKSNP